MLDLAPGPEDLQTGLQDLQNELESEPEPKQDQEEDREEEVDHGGEVAMGEDFLTAPVWKSRR